MPSTDLMRFRRRMRRQMRLCKVMSPWRRQVLLAGEAASFQIRIVKLLTLSQLIQVTGTFHNLAVQLRDLITASGSGKTVADFS